MNKFGNVINAVVFDNFDINALLNRKSNKKTKKNELINRQTDTTFTRNVGENVGENVEEAEEETEEEGEDGEVAEEETEEVTTYGPPTNAQARKLRVSFAEDIPETFDVGIYRVYDGHKLCNIPIQNQSPETNSYTLSRLYLRKTLFLFNLSHENFPCTVHSPFHQYILKILLTKNLTT